MIAGEIRQEVGHARGAQELRRIGRNIAGWNDLQPGHGRGDEHTLERGRSDKKMREPGMVRIDMERAVHGRSPQVALHEDDVQSRQRHDSCEVR